MVPTCHLRIIQGSRDCSQSNVIDIGSCYYLCFIGALLGDNAQVMFLSQFMVSLDKSELTIPRLQIKLLCLGSTDVAVSI